jgi:opacity protein-like surface antigen
MSLQSRLLLPALLMTAASGPALAADYEPPVVADMPVLVDQAPEFVPVEVGSGWYLRGDIGYAISTAPAGAFTYRAFDAGVYTPGTYNTGTWSGDLSFGVGFGYRFTDMLRADITAENFNLRFDGTRAFASPCPGETAGTTCSATDTAMLNSWSILANGYVDLGTIAKFTPYLGAGAGVTYANWGDATSNYTCAGAGCAGGTVVRTQTGIDSWRFTYALMAGFAYDISKNFKLDVGYMFRLVAGGSTFAFSAPSQAAGASGVQASDPGFNQHEIKLGLRYEIW